MSIFNPFATVGEAESEIQELIESNLEPQIIPRTLENLARSLKNEAKAADEKLNTDASLYNAFVTKDKVVSASSTSVFPISLYDEGFAKLSGNFNLQTVLYDDVKFSAFDEDLPNPVSEGIAFNSDGTKMFLLEGGTIEIREYTLSVAFDLSTASYTGVSFNLSSEVTGQPEGMAFNPDGTKMYVAATDTNGNHSIFQYKLSTPFDISTGSYNNNRLIVSSEDVVPRGLTFNDDGTKMYMVGADTDSVYQYELLTPFNIDTASHNGVSFYFGTQDASPGGIKFKPDGTKMYMMGSSSNHMYEYTLSTPFDVSTASHNGVTHDLSSEDAIPEGFEFNTDGSKMFMVGNSSDSVYQYKLTGVNPSGSIIGEAPQPFVSDRISEIFVRADAEVPQDTSINLIAENGYGESVPLTIGEFTDLSGLDSSIIRIKAEFSSDFSRRNTPKLKFYGGHLNEGDTGASKIVAETYANEKFVQDDTALVVEESEFQKRGRARLLENNVRFSIPTASYNNNYFDMSTVGGSSPEGVTFKPDGTKMYTVASDSDSIYQHTLSTAYNISTASHNGVAYDVSLQDTSCTGLAFNDDGTKMYMVGADTDSVYEYELSTPFDLSTASYNGVSFSMAEVVDPKGITFSDGGDKMFIIDEQDSNVHEYSLNENFDLTTVSYNNKSFDAVNESAYPAGITFDNDGREMFIIDSFSNNLFQYDLTFPFDLGSVSYNNNSFDASEQLDSGTDLAFHPFGYKMFVVGNNSNSVYEYETVKEQYVVEGTHDSQTKSLATSPEKVYIRQDSQIPSAEESVEFDISDENGNTDTVTTFGQDVSLSSITGTDITVTPRLKSSDGDDTPLLYQWEVRLKT